MLEILKARKLDLIKYPNLLMTVKVLKLKSPSTFSEHYIHFHLKGLGSALS